MQAAHTFRISTRLPDALLPLRDIALNLGWMSDERVQDLFRRVDPAIWEADGVDALGLLAEVPQERFDELAGDAEFLSTVVMLRDDLRRALDAPRWFQRTHADTFGTVAYFSPEFGLAEALPQYSGGLGILAGDHLKAASDLGVPLVGVGLFYHYGYFQQSLDRAGWQRERFHRLNPHEMAIELVPDLEITVDLAGVPTRAQVWRGDVGSIPLYLLDSDVESNDEAGRLVTDRLYGGDSEQRIRQEILLGVGGVRALEALGIQPDVYHLNEGHATFLALERIRTMVRDHNLTFEEAIEATRAGSVFTTHTSVPAGIDRFGRDLIERYFGPWAEECGTTIDALMQLGEEPGSEPGTTLNLAVMGLHLAGATNGVSELHGEVSRSMFAGVWPDLALEDVPIGHVTNGVHARSWVSREMVDLLDRTVGSNWAEAGPDRWDSLREATDEELWAIRRTNRERLVQYARRYVRVGLTRRGMSATETEWCEDILDPAALTIGFARRFAPYKRADLVLSDLERLFALVGSTERPVQILFAGKAHPADQPGKELLRQVADLAMQVDWRHRLVFLEDYDIGVGRMLIRGADLWLNTPRRPLEACGTSGMKAALNGGLNCSILDGWWDELFDGDYGWAIPSAEWVGSEEERDAIEGRALIAMLEREIVPTFYDRHDGLPREWLRRVRASLVGLGPVLTASRMLRDYVDGYYAPAAHRRRALEADGFRLARDLVSWRARITKEWPAVNVAKVTHEEHLLVGDQQRVTAEVTLGGLSPDEIEVQLWHGPVDNDDTLHDPVCITMQAEGPLVGGAGAVFAAQLPIVERGMHGFTVRAVPSHPALRGEVSLNLPPSVPSSIVCST